MSSASPVSLTAYQRDIWAASWRHPGTPAFNIGGALRLSGEIDFHALEQSCRRAVRRNDAFLLRFAEHDGIPVQWAGDDVPEIQVIDFSLADDARAACLDWMKRAAVRPLPLDGGQPFDIALLRESESVGYLFLMAHHIIADGWGLDQFARQIISDYAPAVPTETALKTAPPSYLTFAEEEARYRGSPQWCRDRDFCRDIFADFSPPLFPVRSPGSTSNGHRRSARHTFTLERKLIDRIRERKRSSVFAFLTAAVATYLSRVHRCEEVGLGVPFLNRHGRAEKRTVGNFASMLPLRLAAHGERSMQDMADQVEAAAFMMKRRERLALGDLLRTLPSHGTGPRRLYDVTLSYLRLPAPQSATGLSTETLPLPNGHGQDALAVHVREFEDAGDIRIDLDYALDVFDEDFPVEAAARHIETLLRYAVDQPEEPVANLPMISPEEHDDLVRARNATDAPYPSDTTLHSLFEEQAGRTPDRIAVAAGDSHPAVTYAGLDARANHVARRLRAEGVRPDDRVAVLVERGPELLAALLGVLKAGGAYVPVDPSYPADRIRFLLDDSGARAVLTSGRDARGGAGPAMPSAAAGACEIILDALPQDPVGPPAQTAGPRSLAYVIYTSGSTGRPKGVMVEHHSVLNRLAWMQKRFPLGADDVVLHKTPSSFDVSVWELFWWGIAGARVALLPVGAEKEPPEILRAVAEQRVTVVHFVPSMFGPFLELLESDRALPARIGHLRTVFCSGEALGADLVARFHRVFARSGTSAPRLVNLYGPTEATVDVSYADLSPHAGNPCFAEPAEAPRRVPIGRPIDNTRLYVLGRHNAPQPVGAPGELCVAGAGLARGYLGRPELTREAFVADPFFPGERMYRTGDLARWLADGTLEYLGRIDEQVKIRGNRVELGEVQSRLAAFPGVRGAAVSAHTSPSRGAYLVGYYVAGEDIDPASLRSHLGMMLPEFMIPARFVRIDRIPLTPNGKADLRALPAPSRASSPPGRASSPGDEPRNAAEATLAAVWREVLDVDFVGIHDNYHALGGDSILMLRVRAEAEKRGLRFTLSDMFRRPTVAGLAAHASTAAAEASADAVLKPFDLVHRADRAGLADAEDAYPATRLQLGMLYHSRAFEGSSVYHDVFRYVLRLPWDEAAFRRCHERLLVRHPVLRSSFRLSGFSQALQVVHPPAQAGDSLEITDLRSASAEKAEADVRAHIEHRRYHPYVFDRPPLCLFRVHLVPSGAVDLVFSFHHALLDGWSVANLIGELLQDYLHAIGKDIAPVPDMPLPSFAAHVRDERRALASEDNRRFWDEALRESSSACPDGFRPHEAAGDSGLVVRHVALPERLTAAVRSFARVHEMPVKSVLLAAHCLTLRLLQGPGEVTTGLVTHGRPDEAGSERTAGLFLNTIPVRLGGSARSWLETVREVERGERESHPYRRYPLSAIQRDGDAVLRTAFNYVNFHVLGALLRTACLRVDGVEIWEQTNFPLLVNAITDPRDGHLELRIDGDGRVFTSSQADLFGRRYAEILRRIVDHPHEKPGFGFLAEEADDVVRRFERQVLYTPRAIAASMAEDRWTYEELDRAADRVARRLLSMGAPPGARIGIAMDRSPGMLAVVLGIAKAGAACVPLDVSYPEDRIAGILARTRPFRVVADAEHAHLVPEGSDVVSTESLLAPTKCGTNASEPPLPPIPPESIAYVLFTSGSTGRPKGVAMPHRALANLVAWQNRTPSGAVGGTTLQFAPLGFDVSFQEIFSTLCGGGTLLLVSEEQRRTMPELLRLLDREGVDRVFLPAVALQQFAEAATALGLRPRRLRVLISSGEQLRVTHEIRRLCAALPGCLLENQYGPTETHVVTSFPLTGDPAGFPDLPPIGRPIDGVEVRVLDEWLRPVPEGSKGEIYLGGACLAEGYEGEPGLTRERFVTHPSGTRLYRTGDLARVLPGGAVVCLERTDTQVKIRGFRVEPGEVELAIRKAAAHQSALREVAVTARRPEGAPAFLAAFLVGGEASVDLGDIVRRLRATLPEYMIPSRFAWVPSLPLTPSGKRDDAALRALPLAPAAPAAAHVPPRDEYESGLAEMLSDLLQIPAPGVHENFFQLGGTSLTAMRLVTMIEKRYRVGVPLSAFIETPTVAALAGRLREKKAVTTFDPLVPMRTSGSRPPLFLVHPIGGNVLCYERLARLLPGEQPVYALQAAGAEPGTRPLSDVPALARSYVEAIRDVRASGPYRLGGWSFGGFVAFEMARQLKASGEVVDRLVLLDSITPGTYHDVAEEQLAEWFLWELLSLDGGANTPAQALPPGLSEQERFDHILRRALEAGVLPRGASPGRVRRLFQVFRANWQALIDYRPDVCDQDLTLLRATGPLPKALEPAHQAVGSAHRDPANGWTAWTRGRVDVIDVPGDHLRLMTEPYVSVVARRIDEVTA